MDNSGAYIAFDVLESLKNFRDTKKSLEGLHKLRAALQSEDGLRVLDQLAEATPNLEELIIIWDHQVKAQDQAVAINLMLTITDVFTVAAQKGAPLRVTAAATALAAALLSRRLKSVYSHLASQQRSRATPALLMLAALAGLGPNSARELVRLFDFSLSALPQLARPARPRKGETAAEAGARQRQEWAAADPAKRPPRAAFVALGTALLRAADAQLLPEVVRLRPLMGGVLHQLSSDPPAAQFDVLKALQRRVLPSSGAGVALGPASKAEVFSDAALAQLAAVAAAGEDEEVDSSDGDAAARRQASDLAFTILNALCVEPAHGLCAEADALAEFRTASPGGAAAALGPGPRRLLRWAQRLRPSESARHGQLLRAAAHHDPALAAALLLALPFSMEPTATGRWLVHAGVVGDLLQAVSKAPAGLLELAERGLPPPEGGSRAAAAALRVALPPCLPRAALSRGVQHGNALVRHAVLCLLGHMLAALEALLAESAAATAALPATASPSLRAAWAAADASFKQAARAALPDLQPVVAQLHLVLAGGNGTAPAPAAANAEALDNDEAMDNVENGTDDVELSAKEAKGLNAGLVSAALQTLRLWRRCLPGALAEGNVDPERLIPEDLAALPALHQLQFLRLLDAGSAAPTDTAAVGTVLVTQAGGAGPGPALLSVLHLLAATKQPDVRATASAWAARRLAATGLFQGRPSDSLFWVDLMGLGGSSATPGFLCDAVGLVLRRPAEFFGLMKGGSGATAAASSLLAVCALRQVLRVLASDKKSQEQKDAVSSYVAAAAALTVMAAGGSGGSGEAAAVAAALLRVMSSEASRAEEASAGSGSKRKRTAAAGDAVPALLESLGPAAAPLNHLTAWLHDVAAVDGAEDDENVPKKKKKGKKESKRGNSGGDEAAVAALLQELPWELFSGCSMLYVEDLEGVPLCQLPLAALQLCQSSADAATAVAAVEAISTSCVGTSPQHAPLVAAQALFLLPAAEQAMSAVVRGAVSGAAKATPSDTLSCISLCCTSPVLAQMPDFTLTEWILAAGARLGAGNAAAAEACRPAVTQLLSEVYQASQTGFSSPPSARLCALLPAAVAAAGPSQAAPAAAALGQIFDQSERSAGIDASWVVVAVAGVVKLAEIEAENADEAVRRACSAAVSMLAIPGREGPACDLLAQLLGLSTWRRVVLEVLGSDGAAAAVRACLTDNSPDRAALACALLESSAEARSAFGHALNNGVVLGALPTGSGEQKKKMKEEDAGAGFLALLPALTTFLERQGPLKTPSKSAVQTAEVVVRQILWWVGGLGEGGADIGSHHETLRQWAVRCLPYALSLASIAQKEALTALKTIRKGSWAVNGVAAEKAAAVDSLLRYLLRGAGKENSEWLTAGMLVPVAQALISALAAPFKYKLLSPEQQATERALLRALDASFNDAVAALPTDQRKSSDFVALAESVCSEFGTAVLRRRAEDPFAMRVLRRLAAALLPGIIGDEEEEEEDDGTLKCPAAAAAASELFQRTVGHSHFMNAMKNAAASPLPLPAEAAALSLPLESLLPAADAGTGADPSAEEESGGDSDSQVKLELCMLLETLLDLEDTYKRPGGKMNKLLVAAEKALLPVTMAAYGGSMSAVDRAVWDLARTLNLRAWRRDGGGSGGAMEVDSDEDGDDKIAQDAEELDALLNGPLSKTCFAWGPSAVAAAATIAAEDGEPSPAALQTLQARLPLDPRRAALAVTHFPERRALFGSFEASTDAVDAAGDRPPELLTHPAVYDPSFLIPFSVAALRRRLLPPRAFVQSALASVCLRATAAEDPGLRSLAYEALGLLSQQLELKASPAGQWPTAAAPAANGDQATGIAGLAGEGVSGGDFRERAQVAALLGWVRTALTAPFTRLPAVHAVFAAEAALLACHPAHTMYAPVAKARLRSASLDLTLVPLFRRVILSGSSEARAERAWLLRLLRAGLRSAADARVYLRQFAPQLVMSLAEWTAAEAGAARAALGVVAAAAAVPRAAREIVERAGLVGWLATRAAAAAAAGAAAPSQRSAALAFQDAQTALGALSTLTRVRAVVGREGGSARAAEDFAQGCRVLLCTLSEASHTAAAACAPAQAAGLASVWAAALEVCVWTAGAAAGAGVPFVAAGEAAAAMTAAAAISAKAGAAGEEAVQKRVRDAGERLVAACAAAQQRK